MRINNKKVIDGMAKYITDTMCMEDIKRYFENFGYDKIDYNIYQYGNLDIYDYDLYLRLVDLGVDTKPVKEYGKVLDFGCTMKHREDIRNLYKRLVGKAVRKIIDEDRFHKTSTIN
jgi:hypothetical protein